MDLGLRGRNAVVLGGTRGIGRATTLKFPDRRIARAADGIKRDAPGTPLVRLSTAGNESWGPVAGKDWMLQRVVYCCRGLSGTVCPIGGRDDGRAA
jgi:NAD(P)-dependent dehydrogenase (short-subunit alcohol dehydrogenase family)